MKRAGLALAVMLLLGCSKSEPTWKRDCPDLENWDACNARLTQKAQAAAASAKADDVDVEGRAARAKAKSAAMTPAERANWVRACLESLGCTQPDVDAIIEGAPGKERERLTLISHAAAATSMARKAKDGSEVSGAWIGGIAGSVQMNGLALFDEMQKVDLLDAKKDPDGSRGKFVRASGSIAEIKKSGSFFEGSLMTDSMHVVRFFTPLSTRGLYENSYATFKGVFVQMFAYPNVAGGETHALLLVGGFELAENKRGTRAAVVAHEPSTSPPARSPSPRASPLAAPTASSTTAAVVSATPVATEAPAPSPAPTPKPRSFGESLGN